MYASRTTKTICGNHTNTMTLYIKVGNVIVSEMVPHFIFTHRCGDAVFCSNSGKSHSIGFFQVEITESWLLFLGNCFFTASIRVSKIVHFHRKACHFLLKNIFYSNSLKNLILFRCYLSAVTFPPLLVRRYLSAVTFPLTLFWCRKAILLQFLIFFHFYLVYCQYSEEMLTIPHLTPNSLSISFHAACVGWSWLPLDREEYDENLLTQCTLTPQPIRMRCCWLQWKYCEHRRWVFVESHQNQQQSNRAQYTQFRIGHMKL